MKKIKNAAGVSKTPAAFIYVGRRRSYSTPTLDMLQNLTIHMSGMFWSNTSAIVHPVYRSKGKLSSRIKQTVFGVPRCKAKEAPGGLENLPVIDSWHVRFTSALGFMGLLYTTIGYGATTAFTFSQLTNYAHNCLCNITSLQTANVLIYYDHNNNTAP